MRERNKQEGEQRRNMEIPATSYARHGKNSSRWVRYPPLSCQRLFIHSCFPFLYLLFTSPILSTYSNRSPLSTLSSNSLQISLAGAPFNHLAKAPLRKTASPTSIFCLSLMHDLQKNQNRLPSMLVPHVQRKAEKRRRKHKARRPALHRYFRHEDEPTSRTSPWFY